MRPKKRILLVDNDAERAGVTSYVFMIQGYDVFHAETPETAVELFREAHVDLVLIRVAADVNADPLLNALVAMDKWCPQWVLRSEMQAWELLERVRLLTARKRGPHPVRPERIAAQLQEKRQVS